MVSTRACIDQQRGWPQKALSGYPDGSSQESKYHAFPLCLCALLSCQKIIAPSRQSLASPVRRSGSSHISALTWTAHPCGTFEKDPKNGWYVPRRTMKCYHEGQGWEDLLPLVWDQTAKTHVRVVNKQGNAQAPWVRPLTTGRLDPH